MTIKQIEAKDAADAFRIIEELTFRDHKDLIFRGHTNCKWKLQSTLRRHVANTRILFHDRVYDDMLLHFYARLASIGIEIPFSSTDIRARLEFGRHYGVPSPVIDFSYSPFVAMFFAFNGIRPDTATEGDRSALYCLNRGQLGLLWARDQTRGLIASKDTEFEKAHRQFNDDGKSMFDSGYPKDDLRLMRFPASWNRRMQRQMGCFLYDTAIYSTRYGVDLEDYAAQGEVPSDPPADEPTLRKILIPHKAGPEIFSRLDLMGLTATHLFDSHEGAAMDVINAYNYGRKTGYAWDNDTLP